MNTINLDGVKIKGFDHIGSTAITGLSGKPVIDITICTEGLLPNIPDEFIASMEKLGFMFCGPSRAASDKTADQMFYYAEKDETVGIDGCLCHVYGDNELSKAAIHR